MILSASGGLVYHARAAFPRQMERWAPTRRPICRRLSHWLSRVRPERLILIGPSAGYLLETDFFHTHDLDIIGGRNPKRLLELVVVDPDPIASLIFRTRFPSSPVQWHRRSDLIPFFSRAPEDFSDFLRSVEVDQKKTAILFFGLLGQIGLHASSYLRPPHEARTLFLKALQGRPWASLHDLESKELHEPLSALPTSLTRWGDETPSSMPEIFARASRLEAATQQLKTPESVRPRESASWIDHETEWLGTPEAIFPWLLSRKRLHLLGLTTATGCAVV